MTVPGSTLRKNIRLPIARRMAELRQEHGRTQEQCATALGLSRVSYTEMESGESRFRRRDLVTLATLYGLSLEVAFPMFVDASEAAA